MHGTALLLTMLSTVVLITPAAYHRIVNDGRDTEAFARNAARWLMISTVLLAAGIAADLLVVVEKITGSAAAGMAVAGGAALLLLCLWLLVPMLLAHQKRSTWIRR